MTIVKVAKVIGAIAGIITGMGVILAFLIYLFFNATEKGKELTEVIEFKTQVDSTILPEAQAQHQTTDMRLEMLEGKHAGTMARVIEWNFDTDAWQLRTFEDNYKRIYPAYKSKAGNRRGRWVYIKNGYEYLVYP